MQRLRRVVLGALLLASCAPAASPTVPPPAAGPPAGGDAPASPVPLLAVRAAYAAPGAALTPVWVAQERGLFRAQGLEVELIFLSGTRTDQGVITGDTPIGFGANVIPTRLNGADIVAIAGVVNRISFTLFVQPGISSPSELRGKTAVTTLPGSSTHSATLIALRRLGLEPGRDVAIQPSPGTTEQLAIMTQGLADAALFSPPTDLKALEAGLVPLLNLAELNIPFMQTAIGTSQAYAREHPEEIRRFLRGYITAVALARADVETTKAIIGKYTQTDDPAILDHAYRYYRDIWGRPDFRVRPEAVESILRVLDVPGADTAQPTDFIDNRFIDELEQAGFIRQVAPFD
ncbi:MAG TPA: ABC transporter substrate-binding protein [Chloroflexota bacterium]|nr:ABC transporter substrate-binding protein [Chloroflexota bacterium]